MLKVLHRKYLNILINHYLGSYFIVRLNLVRLNNLLDLNIVGFIMLLGMLFIHKGIFIFSIMSSFIVLLDFTKDDSDYIRNLKYYKNVPENAQRPTTAQIYIIIIAGIRRVPYLVKALTKAYAGLLRISIYFIKNNSFNVRIALKYLEILSSTIAYPRIPETIVIKSKANQI